jgi:SOS-response transcriptional repressor LexA
VDHFKLHEVLRQLMDEIHISEAELARQTKIPQPTLHRILSGATTSPRGASLTPLANFFSITINQLLGEDPLPKNRVHGTFNPRVQGWKSIPLLKIVDVKDFLNSEDKTNSERWVSTDMTVSKDAFAIVAEGNSMSPRFEEGTVLIFEPEQTPDDQDFVLALIEGQQTPMFKQILVDGDDRYLKSFNSDYRTVFMTKKDELLGILIQAKMDFTQKSEAKQSRF